MKIRFKDGTTKVCCNPKETMLFKNGKKAVWLFSFAMHATAQDIDNILTEDNISEIVIMNNDETQEYSTGGYDAVEGVEINYGDIDAIAEIQLRRGIENGV